MRTRGIYLIPLLGAAAVAEDNFPSRRAEATIALAGPLTGALLAAATALPYFATRNGAFAAAAAWMALINLFNLLPVVPLDGGRVVKSITCSIGSRTGLVAVIAGMLLGAVLAVTADLWIFVILIPLGLLDYLYDRHQVKQAERRAPRHARIAEARSTPALRAPRDEPAHRQLPKDSKDDAEPAGTGIPSAKPPLSPRAAQAAFACYAGLAILLWLFILAMGHQPGAVAAMHALQG
jgi:membrane-associated protease RseP (regulator of RpoE activity)